MTTTVNSPAPNNQGLAGIVAATTALSKVEGNLDASSTGAITFTTWRKLSLSRKPPTCYGSDTCPTRLNWPN